MTCIKLDDLVLALHEKAKTAPYGRNTINTACDVISKLETVNYEEPVVGGYVAYYNGINIRGIKCITCGEEVTFPLRRPYKFCPYCKTKWVMNFKKDGDGNVR